MNLQSGITAHTSFDIRHCISAHKYHVWAYPLAAILGLCTFMLSGCASNKATIESKQDRDTTQLQLEEFNRQSVELLEHLVKLQSQVSGMEKRITLNENHLMVMNKNIKVLKKTPPCNKNANGTTDKIYNGDIILDGNSWILKQPPEQFTIQLLGDTDKKYLLNFIHKYQIQSKSVLYKPVGKNKNWHVVFYGLYKDRETANAAAIKLPPGIKSNGPWPRNIGKIQQEALGKSNASLIRKSKPSKKEIPTQAVVRPKADSKIRPPAPAVTISDKEIKKAYITAYLALKGGHYSHASKAFKKFLTSFPESKYTVQANYWLGESYYAQDELEKALNAFNEASNTLPSGPKGATALLRLSHIYKKLERIEDAKSALRRLIKTRPKSPEAESAQKILHQL